MTELQVQRQWTVSVGISWLHIWNVKTELNEDQSKMNPTLKPFKRFASYVKRNISTAFVLTKVLHARHCWCGIMSQLVSLPPQKLVFRCQSRFPTIYIIQGFQRNAICTIAAGVGGVTSRLNKTISIFTMTRNVMLTIKKWWQRSAWHSKICEIETSWNGKVRLSIVVKKD